MNSQDEAPQNFYHLRFRQDAILGTICIFCGRCIGFSPTEKMLLVLERCHQCGEGRAARDVPVRPSNQR